MQIHGIVVSANASTVSGNTSSNHRGSGILLVGDSLAVFGNTVADNVVGIRLDAAGGVQVTSSVVWNNNLIGGVGARAIGGSGNAFDRGLPDGGNHWSSYDEPGEGCADANGDGFCDTAFEFQAGLVDAYPYVARNGWLTPTLETLRGVLDGLGLADRHYEPLAAKLDTAAALLERGRTTPARNVLGAFINQTQAWDRTGILTAADAERLLRIAFVLVGSLGA